MVVCQHSHCAGAFEAYRGGHIIYGQGNLISDSPDGGDTWYEGFLVRLSLGRDPGQRGNLFRTHSRPLRLAPGECLLNGHELS